MGTHLLKLYMDINSNLWYTILGGERMARTDAERQAVAKYHAKLDEIKIRVPKGNREEWKRFAESKGKSLNQLIVDMMNAAMEENNHPSE